MKLHHLKINYKSLKDIEMYFKEGLTVISAAGEDIRADLLEIFNFLIKNQVSCGIYFPVPFHRQVVYEGLDYKKGDYPNAEFVADHSLALPMFPELTQEEVNKVIEVVNEWNLVDS